MDIDWEEIEQYKEKIINFIDQFITSHRIETDGAITVPVMRRQSIDDGDITERLFIPYFGFNSTWYISVFNIINILLNSEIKPSSIHYYNDEFNIDYNIHSCDPD